MSLLIRPVSFKPYNLTVTIRNPPSGFTSARHISLYAARYGAGYAHGHGHGRATRIDSAPSWASLVRFGGSNIESKTVMNAPVSRSVHTYSRTEQSSGLPTEVAGSEGPSLPPFNGGRLRHANGDINVEALRREAAKVRYKYGRDPEAEYQAKRIKARELAALGKTGKRGTDGARDG